MKKILLLDANPKSLSLNQKLLEAYERGARQAGHSTELIRIRELQFNPNLAEGYDQAQELESDLVEAQQKILWCEHLVLSCPVWWGQMPALAKGFFDRCFLPQFAFDFQESGLPIALLKGRSAHCILTMGAPYLVYRIKFRKCADRAIGEAILKFCGFSPVGFTHIANVNDLQPSEIDEFLIELQEKGAALT